MWYPDYSHRPRMLYSTIHIPKYQCQSNQTIRQPKKEVKDCNKARALLCLLFLDLDSAAQLTQVTRLHGRKARDKIRACFRRYCCGCFCSLCTNPSGYNLGYHRSHSIHNLRLRFEFSTKELFKGPSPIFIAPSIPKLIQFVFWNSQRELIIDAQALSLHCNKAAKTKHVSLFSLNCTFPSNWFYYSSTAMVTSLVPIVPEAQGNKNKAAQE